MFKASLVEKVQRVFDFSKVSFDAPSESAEQECMFIRVESSKAKVTDKKIRFRVQGRIFAFANSDKLPYGYFSKCIRQAQFADTKDLFFFEFEENRGKFVNIVERSFAFLYLYESQYDPDLGLINQLDLEIETNL